MPFLTAVKLFDQYSAEMDEIEVSLDDLNDIKSKFESASVLSKNELLVWRPDLKHFFVKILSHSEHINWSEFLDLLIKEGQTPSLQLKLKLKPIIDVPHVRRESISKIVLIETEKYFCYAILSKYGRVGLYDGNLNFLTTYQIIMTREDITRKEEYRRRRNRWVTDAIFLPDVQVLLITNSTRSLVFYDASGLKHIPLWLILTTPNIVECLAYNSDESILYMGDSQGGLLVFNFLQPINGLFRKKFSDKISLFYWGELSGERDFVSMKNFGRPHADAIKQLTYFSDNHSLISCSKDSETSLHILDIKHRNNSISFKIAKGCNCFAISIIHKVLITGSDDGIVRLWNPLLTAKPTAVLKDHDRSRIIDIVILDKSTRFLSFSSDGNLKLWSLEDQKCVQSFYINFPSFTTFGKCIEWSAKALNPGPKRLVPNAVWERSPILVSCCNHIAFVEMLHQGEDLQVLPAPPLQNSVLVPKMWRTSDKLDDFVNACPQAPPSQDPCTVNIQEKLKDLAFILEKNLFEGNEHQANDINFKISALEQRKLQMHRHVENGAAYLALDLPPIQELRLTSHLPVPNKRKIKNLVQKIEQMLAGAELRDMVFSETSSTRSPRSSRSSIVDFDY